MSDFLNRVYEAQNTPIILQTHAQQATLAMAALGLTLAIALGGLSTAYVLTKLSEIIKRKTGNRR